MSLPKPDKIAVGQWWERNGIPVQIEPWMLPADDVVLNPNFMTYLGSGDNPEPSNWMIRQLARVGSRNRGGVNKGAPLAERDPQYQSDLRAMARSAIAGTFAPAGPSTTELVMLETYSILRELGKW